MESGGTGAEATTDDPLLRRRNGRRTTTVTPIHTKAATKTNATIWAVLMTRIAPQVRGAASAAWGRNNGQRWTWCPGSWWLPLGWLHNSVNQVSACEDWSARKLSVLIVPGFADTFTSGTWSTIGIFSAAAAAQGR